jgi:A/G-specific adenine glycosylase
MSGKFPVWHAGRVELAYSVLEWYRRSARDLPWRAAGATPWAILVSEIMLQQTPVARVDPVYRAWLTRWPTPADLARAGPGDAVRMWGKLGYPRRALRLWECAVVLTERFGGEVPADVDSLLTLPGVGSYTARAVAAFAYRRRHPVVDTNVRRLIARAIRGQAQAGPAAPARDQAEVEALLPAEAEAAARLSVALMELGALVCTARNPCCLSCPLAASCAWRAAGAPAHTGRAARAQRFAGTDRQVRGLLLDVLRGADDPVDRAALDVVWPDPLQRGRALDTLVVDGLMDPQPDGRYALP